MNHQPGSRPTLSGQPALNRVVNRVVRTVLNAIDRLINQLFAFNHQSALLRSMVIGTGFILLWLLFSFTALPAAEYPKMVNAWAAVFATESSQNILIATGILIYKIFLNMTVVRHLLALYVPFWLMQHVASIYLADIFEKEEEIAHTFIRQAAFGESYNTIHIRHGKVIEEDLKSPMIQIGGPGYVVVELDSAVVFEKPDGTAHVIRPISKETSTNSIASSASTNEQYSNTIIHGFERIRQGVDLRDVIQKQEITARSRDGIPVSAKDIQYSYSIYRGANPVKSPQTPYPFDEDAVLNLVYGGIQPVKQGEPARRAQDWLEPLPSKIVGQIGGEMSTFINKRGLSDFLANTGKPEDASLEERIKDTSERMRGISGLDENEPAASHAHDPDQANPAEPASTPEPTSPALEFVSRSVLTRMITEDRKSVV